MTTASPFIWFNPSMMARPKPCKPVFCMGASSGIFRAKSHKIFQVESVLPSSTTTISCGTFCRLNSKCRCSTVEAMHPSSSRAGMTTDKSFKSFLRVGSFIRVPGCLACVSRGRPGFLVVRLAGFVQFQQLFGSCGNIFLALRQGQRIGLLGGDNGLAEASGFSVGGSQDSDL